MVPAAPGDEEQPFHGLTECEGEEFSISSAKAERNKGHMPWYTAVLACNVNSSSLSFQGSHVTHPEYLNLQRQGELVGELCDLDLKGFGVNSLYLVGT